MTRNPDRDPGVDWSADLALALDAALVAGRAVMRVFRTDPAVHHKSPDQPVTDADLEADAALRDRLCGARPDYGWLSEETTDDPARLDRSRVWVVDPIDGTRSFIAGYREFALSIALAEGGEPVVGVVYNPARDEVYWAVRGGDAWRARHWAGGTASRERLSIADPEAGRTPMLLASRSEIGRGEMERFEVAWRVRPCGSTAYKLALVACGAGRSFLSRGPKAEWDVAAGALIVEEAGGHVTDLAGDPIRLNRSDPRIQGTVAGPPALHERLLEEAAGMSRRGERE